MYYVLCIYTSYILERLGYIQITFGIIQKCTHFDSCIDNFTHDKRNSILTYSRNIPDGC